MSSRYAVTLVGWTKGFQTIDMMKLIVQRTPMGLKDAMDLVNLVLEGGTGCFGFFSEEAVRSFFDDALRTGVLARLECGDC